MSEIFKIGPLYIKIKIPVEIPWTREVGIFRTETKSSVHVEYAVHFVEHFQPIWGKIIYKDTSMLVLKDEYYEYRIHYLPSNNEPYVLVKYLNENKIQIYIDIRALPMLKWDRNLLSYCSLEHFLLKENAFLLHASFVVYNGKSIIFTAPSGTGKSTQADLWAFHENAEIINGDRTLLMYANGKWYACGFPICGSSEYCLNKTEEIAAIVCLKQAPENSIRELKSIEAVKCIYSQTFVNNWDKVDSSSAFDLVSHLTSKVPVFEYACTKEKDAVDYLKSTLFHDNI